MTTTSEEYADCFGFTEQEVLECLNEYGLSENWPPIGQIPAPTVWSVLWFGRASSDYNDFVRAPLRDDVKAMNAYMNRISMTMSSYFDIGKRASVTEPERFYHGLVLRLMVDLAERYIITSNRESGFGRYDVMLEPRTQADDATGDSYQEVWFCIRRKKVLIGKNNVEV